MSADADVFIYVRHLLILLVGDEEMCDRIDKCSGNDRGDDRKDDVSRAEDIGIHFHPFAEPSQDTACDARMFALIEFLHRCAHEKYFTAYVS